MAAILPPFSPALLPAKSRADSPPMAPDALTTPGEVTVLRPCLNEAATLATCVRKARACIERLHLDAEVLVVDNGSTDGSQQIPEAEGARVVCVREPG